MWQPLDLAWCRRAAIVTVLGALALLYALGWIRLRRAGLAPAAPWPRLIAYCAGVGITGMALLSPLASLQGTLLSAHMVQHELLLIAGAPLALLGGPLAAILWGLPDGLRLHVGRWLRRRCLVRRTFDALTQPVTAWAVSTALLWLWHAPYLYNAVEASPLLHDAQHLSFFAVGLLFWWPVVQAPPFVHRMTLSSGVGYLAAGIVQRSILGGIITLSNHVLYVHYAGVLRRGGLSALQDQRIAGGIMWFLSGTVLAVATILVIWRFPQAEAGPRGGAPPGAEAPRGLEEAASRSRGRPTIPGVASWEE
jgi:putative membrane protein